MNEDRNYPQPVKQLKPLALGPVFGVTHGHVTIGATIPAQEPEDGGDEDDDPDTPDRDHSN